jgi:hypothetical protein
MISVSKLRALRGYILLKNNTHDVRHPKLLNLRKTNNEYFALARVKVYILI